MLENNRVGCDLRVVVLLYIDRPGRSESVLSVSHFRTLTSSPPRPKTPNFGPTWAPTLVRGLSGSSLNRTVLLLWRQAQAIHTLTLPKILNGTERVTVKRRRKVSRCAASTTSSTKLNH